MQFVFNGNPSRVTFGSGTLARLPEEIDRLGCSRVLILTTPDQEDKGRAVGELIGNRAAGLFANATMHTPCSVTEEAMKIVTNLGINAILAIGGGSTIGLGKAIAVRTDLPQIVVPTTYAGSEMTPILGETADKVKTTRTSPAILPKVVLYDVELTLGLPVELSGTSGINAIAHAVEALYAQDRNPIVSLMAIEAIGAMAGALPRIAARLDDTAARSDALYGAWLCGVCLGTVGMALHHKLCHTIGGMFDLPHAAVHAVVLPHALSYNAPAIPDALARLKPVLGHDPAQMLFELAGMMGAKRALRDLGMPQTGIVEAARQAFANPYWNPRPLEYGALQALIARAWAGMPPLQ